MINISSVVLENSDVQIVNPFFILYFYIKLSFLFNKQVPKIKKKKYQNLKRNEKGLKNVRNICMSFDKLEYLDRFVLLTEKIYVNKYPNYKSPKN